MASDPADLIREADAALDGITPGPWEASGFDNMPHDVVQMEDDEHGTPWAVDQVAGQVKPRDAEFIAAAPDLVRRLRDALEASEAETERAWNAHNEAQEKLIRADQQVSRLSADVDRLVELLAIERDERVEAQGHIQAIADYVGADADVKDILRCIRELAADRAALVEANATIERVEATCDDLDRMNQDTPGMPHANYNREIRRNVVARIRRAIKEAS